MMSCGLLIKRASWLINSIASLCIGLNAVGIDIEAFLHLQSMDVLLRCIAGFSGAGCLITCVFTFNELRTKPGTIIRLVNSIAAFSLGLTLLDAAAVLHLNEVTKLDCIVIGLCGAYNLFAWIRSCKK